MTVEVLCLRAFVFIPGPEVIKLFSFSTQLRSKFILLTFTSRINDWLLCFKPEFFIDFGHLSIYEQLKFLVQLS